MVPGAPHSPDVDGVFALGLTRAEVESRMAEALEAHLAHLREVRSSRSRSAHRRRANRVLASAGADNALSATDGTAASC